MGRRNYNIVTGNSDQSRLAHTFKTTNNSFLRVCAGGLEKILQNLGVYYSNVFMTFVKTAYMKSLEELFPVVREGHEFTIFGFSQDSYLQQNQKHTMLTGRLADFKLPDDYIEVVVKRVDLAEGIVEYIPKETPIARSTPPLGIDVKNDNLIRRIIKDPRTHTKSKVYGDTFGHWPVTYVGRRRVVVQTPVIP